MLFVCTDHCALLTTPHNRNPYNPTRHNLNKVLNTLAACCTIAACFGLMVYTLLEWAAQ